MGAVWEDDAILVTCFDGVWMGEIIKIIILINAFCGAGLLRTVAVQDGYLCFVTAQDGS